MTNSDPNRISDDQHNNAPAVPQGWKLVPVEPTEAMSIAGGIAWESSLADDVIGPLEDAWAAMLAATPAPAPAQEAPSDPNGWCQYVAGMVFCWLQMQEGLGLTSYDEDRFVEAIAGIVQRRLWAYKPAQEVVMPTDKQIIQAMTAEFPTPSLVPMLKGSVICGDFHKALVSAVNVGIAEFCRINGIGQPAQEVGLTDEEIEDVFEQHKGTAGKELRATIGRAIIAAIRAKEQA